MKKLSLLLLTIILLQALVGCRPSGHLDNTQLSTNPSTDPSQSSEVTEPSSAPSTVPSSDPTESTTETQPPKPLYQTLTPVIYKEYLYKDNPFITWDTSHLQEEHLYCHYDLSGNYEPICDEPVIHSASNYDSFFFVKKAEPNTVYSAPMTNFTEHTAIYTSDFGPINFIYTLPDPTYSKVLTIVENNSRGVNLILATGELEVVYEQYYLEKLFIEGLKETDGEFTFGTVMFTGKLNENDRLQDYIYWVESGTIKENPS